MKRLLKSLFVLSLVFSCMTISVHAIDGGEDPSDNPGTEEPAGTTTPKYDVEGSKTASPVELDSNHRNTTVTLSLPSAEYQNKIDIVFVMDNSTSTINSGFDFATKSEALFESIVEQNPGIELKVAVVKFRGYACDMLGTGLTLYNDSTSATIKAAIGNTDVPGNGSNAHSGLVMAEELLSADTDVEDSHKYVIFLTDGKNYIWNDKNNNPTTIYAQYLRKTAVQEGGYPILNQYANSYNREQGNTYITIPEITTKEPLHFAVGDNLNTHSPNDSEYFRRLYNSENAELVSASKYDSICYYAGKPGLTYSGHSTNAPSTANPGPRSGSVVSHAITNAGSLLAPYKTWYEYTPEAGTFWENVNYLQINPYEVVKNEDGTYSYNKDKVNEDFWLWHPDCMMKGTYVTAHYWKEVLVEKYNAASIASFAKGSGAGANIVGSFVHWITEESDFAADITESDEIASVFSDIDNSIRYMVSKGVVTDTIPDEFSLVIPETGFPVKVSLTSAKITSAKDPEKENTWNFGAPIEIDGPDGKVETYEYVVTVDGKDIIWEINVPVKNLDPVSLTYELEIDKDAEPGYHDTNRNPDPEKPAAVLEFEPTTELPGIDKTYEFEVPRVIYNPLIDLTVTKVWDDEDYLELEGYERPEEVTINLLTNGEEELINGVEGVEWPYEYTIETTGKLNEDNELTYTFENLNRYSIVVKEDSDELEITEIDYSVEEPDLAGYVSEVGEFILAEEIAADANRLTGETEVVNTPAEGKDLYTPIKLTVKKVGIDFEEKEVSLAGAEFTLSSEVLEAPVNYVSGEDGTFEIEFKVPGTYTLTETKAPNGYKPTNAQPITIVIEPGDFVKTELNETTEAWDFIYNLKFSEATEALLDAKEDLLVVYNDPVKGEDLYTPIKVQVLKYAVSFFSDDQPLPGAEFTLSGEGIEDTVYVSGEDGTFEIEIAAPGTYTLTETKVPEGFEVDEDEKVHTITVEQGDLVSIVLNEKTGAFDFTYGLVLDEETEAQIDADEEAIVIYNYQELVEFVFKKTWEDKDDSKRPETITFKLLANGVELVECELAAENDWEMIAYLPLKEADGTEIVYEVEEVTVTGYRSEVKYDEETRTFEIVNTQIPNTGDRKDFRVWGLLIAAAIMAISAIMVVDIKKKAIFLYR